MAYPRSLPLYVLASALLCSTAAMAQSFAPAVRIVDRIDDSHLVALKGNTHPYANAKNDRGRVSPTLPMTDLILVLSRSAEQQAVFDQFVASQYEPGSPNYHHWLEPDEVGDKFGPSLTDIATISNWLTGQGFSVDEVTKDRMSIRFSGTAGQVESAFHTEMHNLEVKGEAHIGNMSDPQIPAALAPAVVGVKSLHNFFPKPLHHLGSLVTRDSTTGRWKRPASAALSGTETSLAARPASAHPEFTVNDTTNGLIEDVAPYDFATIYNVLPLWNAGIDGTGQTIAIAGTSSINLSDITSFRSIFGLPTSGAANTPRLVSGNSSPVTICSVTSSSLPFPNNSCGIGDVIENSVDVEWSGAVAKNAQIVLVSSYPISATDDGLYDSESYIVNNKTAPVMNVSYGECELGMGTAQNAQYNTLWQTAATEGIAVFVSSGDSGSAGCDDGLDTSTPYAAEYGLSVSGFASTPYNTAVGGTDFNWCKPVLNSSGNVTGCSSGSPYWNSTNASNGSSALGYVPEVPWNDDCGSPPSVAYLTSLATYLNVSGVNSAESACNFVANYWRQIYTRYQVNLSSFIDITGGSGGVSGCTINNSSTVSSCTGGYAKPSWQTGVTGIPSDGKRDIPDVSFFAGDGAWDSAYLMCVSETGSACVSSTTITTEPQAQEVGGTSLASPAMAGVMALINQKTGAAQGNPNAQLYALAAKQSYSSCSAESVTAGSTSCYFNDIDTSSNAVPCVANSPNCTVLNSGDSIGILSGYNATTGYDLASGLGSLNVANVVNAWVSSAGTATATMTVTPSPNPVTTVQSLTVTVTLTGSGNLGAPTGTVTLSGGGYSSSLLTLVSGRYAFSIPAGSLAMGADKLTVVYSGDSNYASVTNNSTTEQVNGLTSTVHVTPSPTSVNSNVALSVAVTVTGSGPTPTGTVTLSGGGYSSGAQTLASGSYTFTIPANTFSASGTVTLAALYSGDTTYVSSSGSSSVTVTFIQVLTPTVTVTPASNTVNSNASLNVTTKVTGTGATPTGTVALSGGGLSSTLTGTLSGGSYTFTIPANSLNTGIDTLTVTYNGDANYYPGTGTATVTVTQSTFTLAASAPAAIASPGLSTTSTVTVTAVAGYAGTAALSCTPTYTGTYAPTCSITSTPLSMGGTATATVLTTAATAELVYPKIHGKGRGWAGAGGGAVLAFLVFLGIPARRRSWRSMLGILVLMITLGSLAACGGGGGGGGSSSTGTTGTPLGSYTFTVIGVGSPSVSPVPSTTFTVTVN